MITLLFPENASKDANSITVGVVVVVIEIIIVCGTVVVVGTVVVTGGVIPS